MRTAGQVQEVDAFDGSRGHFAVMEKRLSSPDMMNAEHGELEKYVMEQGMELQRLLLQAHMELRAAREQRVAVRGADGVLRTTVRASTRPLMTMVGVVDVPRAAYQARDVDGLHPMDASLNLAPTLYSQEVERFVAEQAAIMSFDDVRHALLRQSGARVAKRQVEEMAVRAAVDSTRSTPTGERPTTASRRRAICSCSPSTARGSSWCPTICDPRRKRRRRRRVGTSS